jgi:hypothetical protein
MLLLLDGLRLCRPSPNGKGETMCGQQIWPAAPSCRSAQAGADNAATICHSDGRVIKNQFRSPEQAVTASQHGKNCIKIVQT